MRSNWYSTNRSFKLRGTDFPKILWIMAHRLESTPTLAQAYYLQSIDFALFWFPQDMSDLDCRKLNRRYSNKGLDDMTKQTTFVMNNLTKEQLKNLDTEYPTIGQVDSLVCQAVEKGFNFAIRANKDGGYIVFANQENFTTVGRSSSPYDALVIATYKAALCDFNLSIAEDEQPKTQRG